MGDALRGVAVWLASPLSIATGLFVIAWWLGRRRAKAARRWAIAAFVVLWVGSMPLTGDILGSPLEKHYAPVAIAAAPVADAIVVLGGALAGANPPLRPNMAMGPSADRVWQAAALYRAGKARWVIVAAGERDPRPGLQVEGDAIAQMLAALGVPRDRIRIDDKSRTTRENAANALPIAKALGATTVLLVTSAQHMPRAMRTFERSWSGSGISCVAFPADVSDGDDNFTLWALLPTPDALRYVTRVLKEYAGTVGLVIMDTVTR